MSTATGKGSKRRPMAISQEEWERRWKLAFGTKEPTTPPRPNESGAGEDGTWHGRRARFGLHNRRGVS